MSVNDERISFAIDRDLAKEFREKVKEIDSDISKELRKMVRKFLEERV